MSEQRTYKADELLFSSHARCKCGAGLAYPLHFDFKNDEHAWICSALMLGEAQGGASTPAAFGVPAGPDAAHDVYPFAFYSIKSEDQGARIGNASTRRPDQGHAEVRTKSTCKKCGTKWNGAWRLPADDKPYDNGACIGCNEPQQDPKHGGSNSNIENRRETRIVQPAEPVAMAGPDRSQGDAK